MRKVLLIGASGGIGNKVAETLLEIGYEIHGTYFKHPERVENLKNNPLFTSSQLDLQDIHSIENLQDKFINNGLHSIVNCSGVVSFENDEIDRDIKIWNETLAVNLTGNYLLSKLLKTKLSINGRFIMISSTDSFFGGAITTSYAASKSGVNSLTKSLSLYLQDKKIRVNSIAPGWVITPMIEGNGEEFLEKVANINPLKRNALPVDVANTIKFLLSEDSSYINGQVISLEGGYTNQDPTLFLEEEAQQ